MSYQVKCELCANEYLLQAKPDIGTRIKCCICKNIWTVHAKDIIEYKNEYSSSTHTAQASMRIRAFTSLISLFFVGMILWYMTSSSSSFMVLNTRILQRSDSNSLICDICNKTGSKKCIKTIKVNFEKMIIEYKLDVAVEANETYTFTTKVCTDSALPPTVEVKE